MSYFKDDNIMSIYEYGSHVYGTNNLNSDRDIIVVLKDIDLSDKTIKDLQKNYDVNVYSQDNFEKMIREHEITALECLFLKDKNILKYHNWNFELNLVTLRNSISQKSSNSWVKAKKKFIIEKDYAPYVGQKSAWHAIRILDFGTQIAKFGTISDYAKQNNVLYDILKCDSWEIIDSSFRKKYNETASIFRQSAPKEINLSANLNKKQ